MSKAVGGSVVRHRVARRLRHLMSKRLAGLPPGSRLVVRALPTAAGASSASLGSDLDRALRAALAAGYGTSARSGSAERAGKGSMPAESVPPESDRR